MKQLDIKVKFYNSFKIKIFVKTYSEFYYVFNSSNIYSTVLFLI